MSELLRIIAAKPAISARQPELVVRKHVYDAAVRLWHAK